MNKYVVAYYDQFDNEIVLETVEANNWKDAVQMHTKYPYKETDIEVLCSEYGEPPEESFKQCCFDCDTMMNWIIIV